MPGEKKSFFSYVKEYLGMTIASLANAVCLYTFVNPSKIVAGGITGVSTVLSYVISTFVESVTVDDMMSIIYILLNLPIIICSLVMLRGDFTFKSIYSTVVSTIALGVLPVVFPHFKFSESTIISTIMGGMLLGFAMHFANLNGASNGGTEIIGKIVSVKRPELDISKVVTVINFIITIFGAIVLIVVQNDSPWLILYSLLFVIVAGEFMGILQRGFDHPQKYLIITEKYQELADDITKRFKRGLSVVDIQEQKDGVPRKMIMVIVQYRQAVYLKYLIKKHDPNAFTIVKDVHDIFSRPTFNRSYNQK